MDFSLPPELTELRTRVRTFVDEQIIPVEHAVLAEDAAGKRTTFTQLREHAKAEGLFVPHLPREVGGLGLGLLGMCALFQEMGRSPIGPKVFNCDAPDQGNMDLLLATASAEIRSKWLLPLTRGEITSAFCMTEPAPGAGADPSNLRTQAVRVGNEWVIEGHKWYSTGGKNASFLIVMARTSDDSRDGATMFVVDRHAPGVELTRVIPVMTPDVLDHHETEFIFRGVRVDDSAVLKGVGEGFRLAQARLVPARLTHCMRWIGLADRALGMCREQLSNRRSFGKSLGEHQMMQLLVAENAEAIYAGSLMTWHAATMLEHGDREVARAHSSLAKRHVARALCKVLDDAIQIHGGKGYSDDLPFQRWYRAARAARIVDGPDEVHAMVVAREFLKGTLRLVV